jgi:hypothetical protein
MISFSQCERELGGTLAHPPMRSAAPAAPNGANGKVAQAL